MFVDLTTEGTRLLSTMELKKLPFDLHIPEKVIIIIIIIIFIIIIIITITICVLFNTSK